MKILYIATSFPEPNKGSTIYTDLAEELYKSGHQITVAVSEQSRNLKKTIMKRERGFYVLRIVTGNYYDVNLIEKGITTLKIPHLMRRGILRYLSESEFDFILFESPPVTNAQLVNWAKKKYNCSSYLMLKDIFPQNAVDIDMIKTKGLIYKFFLKKEKQLYDSADIIGCMSEGNRDYILKHNPSINPYKVEIFPNTKRLSDDYLTNESTMRVKFDIPRDACVFLFGGNMGKPQYIDLLCDSIIECKNNEKIFFLFIGRGTERYKLEKAIEGNDIKNALVIENLPRDEYDQMIKECDVGLILLDPRFTIPNFPSRILSYMEYAKPVLAATDKATDFNKLISDSGCGKWVWSGDKEAFINEIKNISNTSLFKSMGISGRKYIEKNLNLNKSVEILENHFNQ